VTACENRSLHDADEYRPREIHENIEMHFDRIVVDGIEYLILEKDYNNPHEGFGFMAFRANKLVEKQDTVIAYLRTISDMQVMNYQKLYGVSSTKATALRDTLFNKYLKAESSELIELEKQKLESVNVPGDSVYVN
jgi:hypothetical protein